MDGLTDQAFVIHEIIDGNRIDPGNIRCPRCFSNTLVLKGQDQIPLTRILELGETTSELRGSYEDGSFDMEELNCMSCNIRFIIKDHTLFVLEQENDKLKEKLRGKPLKPDLVH